MSSALVYLKVCKTPIPLAARSKAWVCGRSLTGTVGSNPVVFFRTQLQRELTLHDLIDFLKRTKWKMYQRRNRRQCVGNYFIIIDEEG